MKLQKNIGYQISKDALSHDLELDVGFRRYKAIKDYEDNTSMIIPKIIGKKNYLFQQYNRHKQIKFSRIYSNPHERTKSFPVNYNSNDILYSSSQEQLQSNDFDYNSERINEDSNNNNNDEIEDTTALALNHLINEYDQCINTLKQQYQLSKELRRKSEVDSKAMEHRIALLQNQEKYVIIQFNNTKKKIEQILKNRALAEMNIKHNINQSYTYSKSYTKKKLKTNPSRSRDYSLGNISNGNPTKELKQTNSRKIYSNSNIDSKRNKEDEQANLANEINSNNQRQNSQYKEENHEDYELSIKKKKIKEELLNKLKEEEEERLRLENEIAMIEKEELKLLKMFNVNK